MENTTKHRGLRIPTELDEHILNTEEHATIIEKYVAVLRRGLNLPAEHVQEHTGNTQKDWASKEWVLEQIEEHLNGE